MDWIARGWMLVAEGVPCPEPGMEACYVYCEWEGGPAWWDEGRVYVRTPEARETLARVAALREARQRGFPTGDIPEK